MDLFLALSNDTRNNFPPRLIVIVAFPAFPVLAVGNRRMKGIFRTGE